MEIVVPVRNEERDLAPSVRRLAAYLRESFPFTTRITIADNGSTDRTPAVAGGLARELGEDRVRAMHLADLRGIVRVRAGLARGTLKVPRLRDNDQPPRGGPWQLPRFLAIGAASTLACTAVCRGWVSHGSLPPQRNAAPAGAIGSAGGAR